MSSISAEAKAAMSGGDKAWSDAEPSQTRTGPWPPAGDYKGLLTAIEVEISPFRFGKERKEKPGYSVQFHYNFENADGIDVDLKGSIANFPSDLDAVLPQLHENRGLGNQAGVRATMSRVVGAIEKLTGTKPCSSDELRTAIDAINDRIEANDLIGVLFTVSVRQGPKRDDGKAGTEYHTDYINDTYEIAPATATV